jgi:hypothetical protein
MSFMLSINNKKPPELSVSFGALMQRYLAEELPERHSTSSRYRCWMKNHMEPKWRDFPIERIKPLLVEDWLKKLVLAPKSKAHLKTLMHILFNAANALGADSLSTQPHEPRSRQGQFEATKRTKVSDCARVLRSLGTHS